MKAGTPWHYKTRRLATALNVPLCQAVGMLEMLWHTTAAFAPRGDIGRLSDEEIANTLECGVDSNVLIPALVGSGWLERDEEYRLLVHDWPEHAQYSVSRKLNRSGQMFISDERKGLQVTNLARGLASSSCFAVDSPEEKLPKRAADDLRFDHFVGVFVAAGRQPSPADVVFARTHWDFLTAAAREKAIAGIERLVCETETDYIPFPASYLKQKKWLRSGPGRLIPEPRKNSGAKAASMFAEQAEHTAALGRQASIDPELQSLIESTSKEKKL